MKKEFPVLSAKVSVWIAMPLVYSWACFYVQRAIELPASEVYAVGMAAFGVTAALSAVCFAMAVAPTAVPISTFAGEKFLHSSILIVQTLLIISVRDAVLKITFLSDHGVLLTQARGLFAVIVMFVAFTAVFTWHNGFSDLNAALWKNWEQRVNKLNERSLKANRAEIDVEVNKTEDKDVGAK
ncbi:MAG: hypothetical protein ACLQBD_02445 [Syntrophobacteraceae bacterium]